MCLYQEATKGYASPRQGSKPRKKTPDSGNRRSHTREVREILRKMVDGKPGMTVVSQLLRTNSPDWNMAENLEAFLPGQIDKIWDALNVLRSCLRN